MSRVAYSKVYRKAPVVNTGLLSADLSQIAEEIVVTSLDNWFHKSTVEAIEEIIVRPDSDLEADGSIGVTEVEDEDTRPRILAIGISTKFIDAASENEKLFRHEFIKLIAHEMIHVRQFAQKRLKSCLAFSKGTFTTGFVWDNAEWKPPRGMPVAHRYWMSPWEIEARAVEEPTFHFWQERFDEGRNWAMC